MNMPVLTQIQENINRLSSNEQLWLIEWLAHRVREKASAQSVWASQLADMAADPEIQSELRKIDAEFALAETDGLETTP
jgi:hypothetical protein